MRSRSDNYRDGWHQGRRWAEEDILNHEPVTAIRQELTDWYARHQRGDSERAFGLGVVRGYRDTIDRFERGEITWETFDKRHG